MWKYELCEVLKRWGFMTEREKESLECLLGRSLSHEQLEGLGVLLFDVWDDGTRIYKAEDSVVLYVCVKEDNPKYHVLLRVLESEYERGSRL